MKYERRDIVLIKYPFTNLKDFKLRPALILWVYQDDVIIIPITTKKTGYFYEIKTNDLIEGELITKSYLKINSIFTLNKDLIFMKIAVLSQNSFDEILLKFVKDVLKFNK